MDTKLLIDGLNQIKNQFGIATLHDARKTTALFSDLVANARTERRALECMYSSGAMEFILSAAEGSVNPDTAVLQAVSVLKSDAFMDEAIAFQLADAACTVFGLQVSTRRTATPSQNTSANATVQNDSDDDNNNGNDNYGSHNNNNNYSYSDDYSYSNTGTYHAYTPSTRLSSRAHRRSIPWKKVAITAAVLLVIGVIVGVSIYSWQIGQWLVGIVVALAIVLAAVAKSTDNYFKPWVILGVTVVNIALAWLFPMQYSTTALPIALGTAIASIICAYVTYSWSDDYKKLPVVLVACNLAVATSIPGGFKEIQWWLLLYIAPAALIAYIIVSIYDKFDGENGIWISSITAVVIIAAHAVLAFMFPHYLHNLHALPELLTKEYGPNQAICYCGEEVELSEFVSHQVHGLTCEFYDSWNPFDNGIFERDEERCRQVCLCGMKLWDSPHVYKDGVCLACGYRETDKPNGSGISDETSKSDESRFVFDERARLYSQAEEYLANGNIGAAAIAFAKCGDYSDARSRTDETWSRLDKHLKQTVIVSYFNYIIWVNQDGTVSKWWGEQGACDVPGWHDIAAISLGYGGTLVGLKDDGTVIATDEFEDVSYLEWTDIVSISAGDGFLLGLKKDGTVLACGNNDHGQCNVSGWSDIVSIQTISQDGCISFGVRSDGSVMIAGAASEEYAEIIETSHLSDIKYASNYPLAFITNSNRVAFAVDFSHIEQQFDWISDKYENIIDCTPATLSRHLALLREDGTVIPCNTDVTYEESLRCDCDICTDIRSWEDICQLAICPNSITYCLGLREDGSLAVCKGYFGLEFEAPDFASIRVKVYK